MCGLICLHHFKTSNAKYITICNLKCASVLNVLKAVVGVKAGSNRTTINILVPWIMDQESLTCNGVAAGTILLVKCTVSVQRTQMVCLVVEKACYCQWVSWDFYGIHTHVYILYICLYVCIYTP